MNFPFGPSAAPKKGLFHMKSFLYHGTKRCIFFSFFLSLEFKFIQGESNSGKE
jgi:hypothetical protein